MKFAVVGMVAFVVLTGCGSSDVVVHSGGAQQLDPTAGAECPIEYKTLEVATEAYWTATGGPPSGEGELVSAGFLRQEVGGFDLLIGDTAYELVAVASCEAFVPS